jgi:hypothetical protein
VLSRTLLGRRVPAPRRDIVPAPEPTTATRV